MALPSDTPGRSPNEMLTAGNLPVVISRSAGQDPLGSAPPIRAERSGRPDYRTRFCSASRDAPDTADRVPAARGIVRARRKMDTLRAEAVGQRRGDRVAFPPTAAVLSRSIVMFTRGLRSMSFETSWTSGSAAMACSSRGAHATQLVVVQALDRQVEAAVASKAADLEGRRHRDEGPESREASERAPEFLRDLLSRAAQPRGAWRQLNGEPARVLVPAASIGSHEGVDAGFASDEVGNPLRVTDHFIIRVP